MQNDIMNHDQCANSGGDNMGLIERIVYLHSDTQVQNSNLPLRSEPTLLLSNLPKSSLYASSNEKAMTSACCFHAEKVYY